MDKVNNIQPGQKTDVETEKEFFARIDEYTKNNTYKDLQALSKERGVKATGGSYSIAERLVDQDFPEGRQAFRRELIRKGKLKPTLADL